TSVALPSTIDRTVRAAACRLTDSTSPVSRRAVKAVLKGLSVTSCADAANGAPRLTIARDVMSAAAKFFINPPVKKRGKRVRERDEARLRGGAGLFSHADLKAPSSSRGNVVFDVTES